MMAMDQKPWYQKEKLDPAFPFRLWDSSLRVFSPHWHEPLEIIYVLRGTISLSVDGQPIKTTEGDIVIVNSGMIHSFFDAYPETLISIFQFGLELFDQTLIELRDRFTRKLVFDRRFFFSAGDNGDLYQKIKTLLLSIRGEYLNKEEGFRLAIKSKLYELALTFLRELPVKNPVPREMAKHNYNRQILERVFSFVYSNYGNSGISLEQAARAAALSKYYFTRFFREQTGQTFHAYLSQVRIKRAKEYLTESDLPVAEIAYLCGFASLKTFYRLFKVLAGVSPSAYRSGEKNRADVLSPVS
ncbi:MAG: AraC family transcriptional regulator [Spirochaetaceae bacterium]|jgi:AraC-like DNA-binding protein|nr:AraC family transcriptional regulator [Spirochaetaceae bacterium]